MADIEATFVLEEQPGIQADFNMTVVNEDHNVLINRDLPNQHPMSAITGLETALGGKQDIISDLSEIRSGSALGATALQPNDNISELVNNAGYITSSALTGYATETWVGNQGYITGITSYDVTNALGYTPYNSTNPDGYTDNVGTVTSVNNISPDNNGNVTLSIPAAQVQSDWAQADNTKVDYIKNKPTIPTVNNATLTITQGGVSKGTFTANASSDVTIALDSGGGGSTYTAGDGIDITNNVISVDGVQTNEVTLATVATTGEYSDLTGTPSLSGYQTTSNLVTSISSLSTDSQYPSAKCMYDLIGDVESLLSQV